MVFLIAAIVVTLSVLEGHFPIASIFKCNIFICGASCGPFASAELFVLFLLSIYFYGVVGDMVV